MAASLMGATPAVAAGTVRMMPCLPRQGGPSCGEDVAHEYRRVLIYGSDNHHVYCWVCLGCGARRKTPDVPELPVGRPILWEDEGWIVVRNYKCPKCHRGRIMYSGQFVCEAFGRSCAWALTQRDTTYARQLIRSFRDQQDMDNQGRLDVLKTRASSLLNAEYVEKALTPRRHK